MNNQFNTKIKYSMNKRLMLTIVALCLVLCVSSSVIGFIQYNNTIKEIYNQDGYILADIIINSIDINKIEEYTKTWKEDEYYTELKDYIDKICISSNVKYIYIAIPNRNGTIKYIYDSSGMNIGDTDPITKYTDEIVAIYNTGYNPRTNYFVRNSVKYGYITCSILPIKNSYDDTIALLFVDTSMDMIQAILSKYIFKVLILSVIFMAISLQISYLYMKKRVINPIHIIEDCLNRFAEDNTVITNELTTINTRDELEDLSSTIFKMEKSVVDYIDKITAITSERERIGVELDLATKIQTNMLPNQFPPFPDIKEFDIYATMDPAKEVGGDFYDFFAIDGSHIGIVMADVSGKGIPAALFMMISKTLIKIRTQMSDGVPSPADILFAVNNQLCESNKVDMFVTAWLGILDINTGIITCANAGHEYPVIKHNNKFDLYKDRHSFILAGMNNYKYKDYEIKLEKDDKLFIYTDGVTEATDSSNNLFGIDRMINALNKSPDAECSEIIKNVQSAIDEFVDNAPQFDDITMLCLKYNGKDNPMNEITVEAVVDNINKVTDFIDNNLENANCSIKTISIINIAIDEILSNIIYYSYPDGPGNINVKIIYLTDPNRVSITFIDEGIPYNPLEKEDPDTKLKAEDREIGGLGIYIVKQSMDNVYYSYENNKNIFTIEKNY